MRVLPIIAILLTLTVLIAWPQQPDFTVDDLKRMIADRDIQIEILNRRMRDLELKLEACPKPPADLKKTPEKKP